MSHTSKVSDMTTDLFTFEVSNVKGNIESGLFGETNDAGHLGS